MNEGSIGGERFGPQWYGGHVEWDPIRWGAVGLMREQGPSRTAHDGAYAHHP